MTLIQFLYISERKWNFILFLTLLLLLVLTCIFWKPDLTFLTNIYRIVLFIHSSTKNYIIVFLCCYYNFYIKKFNAMCYNIILLDYIRTQRYHWYEGFLFLKLSEKVFALNYSIFVLTSPSQNFQLKMSSFLQWKFFWRLVNKCCCFLYQGIIFFSLLC